MTNELWAALIGAVVILLTNLAGLVKVWSEMAKTKADRVETKRSRDRDSSELHDQCQKNTWDMSHVKEDIMMLKTHLDDHQLQISTINTELAKVSTKLDTVLDAIKQLTEAKQ